MKIHRPLVVIGNSFLATVLFVGVSFPISVVQEQEDAKAKIAEALEAGNQLLAEEKFPEALARYREGLVFAPESEALLFNGGLAAYLSGQYETAVKFWEQLKQLGPKVWQVRVKLIQGYQALNNLDARDKERKALVALRKLNPAGELAKSEHYMRDRFEVNGRKILAFEHFELRGERAVRYSFVILNEEESDEDFRISLGSYEMTNRLGVELGLVKEGERRFHLDGYFQGGLNHALYGFYSPEPSYDEIKEKVVQIVEGRTKPLSSTTTAPLKEQF